MPPLSEIEESNEISQDDVEDLRWNKRTQHLMHTLDVSNLFSLRFMHCWFYSTCYI